MTCWSQIFWNVLSQQISLQLHIAFLWLPPLKLPNFNCVWSILHTSLSPLLETCHHWSLMSWAWGVRATLASSLFSSLTEVVSLVSPALPLHVGSAWVMGVWHHCISCYHTNTVPLFLSPLIEGWASLCGDSEWCRGHLHVRYRVPIW